MERLTRRRLLQAVCFLNLPYAIDIESIRTASLRSQLTTAASDSSHSDRGLTAPSYPDSPVITTRGGSFEPAKQRVPPILDLHPDALSIPGRGGIEFSNESAIPATTGSFTHIDLTRRDDDPLYERLRKRERWTYPDGSFVEDATDLVGQTFDGSLHAHKSEAAWRALPSLFAEGTFEYVTEKAKRRFERGFSGVLFGNSRLTREFGLDFSIWARYSFRNHLTALSTEKLSTLGIDNPESFNIRKYLENQDLTLDTDRHPAEDPVFREYLRHHHLGIKAFFNRIKRWLEDSYPELDPPIHANQPIGDPTLANAAVVETYLSDQMDFIHTEDWRTIPTEAIYYPGGGNRPEVDIRDFVYKLMLATGRFDKTVHVVDGFGGSYYTGFEPERDYPMLLRLQAAEAYAMGARRDLTLSADGPLHWLQKDGSLPDRLRDFADFLWAHQRFLTAAEPDNDVAVVWSLPTLLWNTIPQWNQQAWGHTRTFHGTVTLLREAQYAYDVLVFGHPDLWPDGKTIDRLQEYEAIVLPAIECVTDTQLNALHDVLDGDRTLISSGPPPDRTGSYKPRSDIAELFDRENGIVLPTNPGKQRWDEGKSDGSLIDTLDTRGVVSLTSASDGSLGVNRLEQPNDSRRIIHLLNYDYNPETDGFRAKSDIELRLDDVDSSFSGGRFYSPQRIQDVTIDDRNGYDVITVPEVVEWGFVVVAPSETDLRSKASESAARSEVQQAGNRVKQVQESSQEWTVNLALTGAALRAAEVALDYEAYSLALNAGQRAKAGAEELMSPTPTRTGAQDPTTTSTSRRTEGKGTPATSATTRMGPPGTTTTSGEARGFGVLSALAGIAATIVAIRRFVEEK